MPPPVPLMQIHSKQNGDLLVLELNGRFDANWSDHVGDAIETAIRAGKHEIDLDFQQVSYLSSAGIRVLMKYYRQLAAAKGRLRVCNANGSVMTVLNLTRIASMLCGDPATPKAAAGPSDSAEFERGGCTFASYSLRTGIPLQCELFGRPELFAAGQLRSAKARPVKVEASSFCLGLGAFGDDGVDATARYGEALGVAGVAVQQSTDSSSVPDFQVSQGELVPELRFLYGLQGRGDYSRLIRFEAGESERGSLPLSELIAGVLGDLHAQAAAFALVAESASVIGASLVRSPAFSQGTSPWEFPEIRNWLTFTSEQNDDRNLVLIVGVACKSPDGAAQAFLRPFGASTDLAGHFHAAVMPYRPLPKGMLNLAATVNEMFTVDSARSVRHLLADDRPFEGVGETELMRGACWCGPLQGLARTT